MKDNGKKILSTVNGALRGHGVTSHFFMKHLVAFAMIVTLSLMYISVRFDCWTSIETINALREEIKVIKTESQAERATYMSSIRESNMKQMVDSLGLGLSIQERPAYTLSYNVEQKK